MRVEAVTSTEEYQGRNFKVKRVNISWTNGKTSTYDVLEHPGSTIIIPVTADGNIMFVRQYRYAVGKDLLELPAGTKEEDESYEECAAREIREETGMEAGRLQKVGEFYLAPGYSSEFMAVFLATDLKHNPLDADEDEFLQVEKVPVREVTALFERGDVPDSKSLAAWLLAKPYLEEFLG